MMHAVQEGMEEVENKPSETRQENRGGGGLGRPARSARI